MWSLTVSLVSITIRLLVVLHYLTQHSQIYMMIQTLHIFPCVRFCTLQHPAHVTSPGSVCDISFLRLSLNNTVSPREMQCTSLYGPTAHSPFLEAHFIAKKASYEICKAKCKMTLCSPFLKIYSEFEDSSSSRAFN